MFHWVPDHPRVLARLLGSLPSGGVLAVQMPDNTKEPALMLMEQVATSLAQPSPARSDLPRPEGFFDLLGPLCRHVDIWHTHYNHIIEDHQGVVEWFKGSGMRPFLAPLSEASRKTFFAKYSEEIRRSLSGLLGRQGSAAVPALVHGCGAVKRAAMAKWLPIVKTDDVKLY